MRRYIYSARKSSSNSKTKLEISEARNSRDPKRLAELAKNSNSAVRGLVSQNKYTDSATLASLVKDPYIYADQTNYDGINNSDLFNLAEEGYSIAAEHLADRKDVDHDTLLHIFDLYYPKFDKNHLDKSSDVVSTIVKRRDVLDDSDYEYLVSLNNVEIDWWISLTSHAPVSVYNQIINRYSGEDAAMVREAMNRLSGKAY